MHVIVTGGAGFIGSNLAAESLRDGRQVTVLDSLQRQGSERNLDWLQSQPGAARLRFIQGDVRDHDLVRSVVGAPDVHMVCHLAAQTAVTTSMLNPREDLEVNVLGTHNVLEAVRASHAQVAPMVFFTSTNKVYGALPNQAAVEDTSRYRFANLEVDAHGIGEREPLDFHSPYGCSKGAADQYVHDYARMYNLRTVVFRMSCIYGPRQFGNEDQGWLAHFMLAVAAGAPLTIYGTGKQVRDVLFIDDLVRAFKLAARHIDRTAGHVYNIGGGPSNSISVWTELGPRLQQLAGRSLQVQMAEWRPGDQPVYVSDTRRAARDFLWSPRVDVDQGLGRLWTWAQSLIAGQGHPAAAAEGSRLRVGPKSHVVAREPLRAPGPRADVVAAGPPA